MIGPAAEGLRLKEPSASIFTGAAVRYKTSVLNPDGSVARTRDFKKNLILDQGLNLVATTAWADCFLRCAVGTGTTVTQRDSGAVTFTRSGTTVLASAGFFESADTGRLLKLDSGEEMYLTFTDATHCESNISGALGASAGTVWYVNQTGLTTESTRTGTVSTDGGDNGTSFSVDTLTHKRTFLFPAVGANVTYNEIGWSNTAGAGANLFGRDLIPGGDALLIGQQYKVVVQLLLKISPVASTAAGDVGNNGFNTAGDCNHEYILDAYSKVISNGTSAAGILEPSINSSCGVVAGAFTLLAAPSFTSLGASPLAFVNLTNAAYTNGNFYRDSSGTFALAQGNSADLRALVFGNNVSTDVGRMFSLRFTNAQTKDSSHTLTVTLRKSWGRTLVN